MKIGSVSRLTNIPVSTIRYYINQGLLLPEKTNNQYRFSPDDLSTLHFISMWKTMGFSIEQILQLVTLKRSSNWIEIENFVFYTDQLKNKKEELLLQDDQLQKQLALIEKELLSMKENEFFKWENSQAEPQGFPLDCLKLIICPHCGNSLMILNANMDSHYIYTCSLYCNCGYHATITDGIILSNPLEHNPFHLFFPLRGGIEVLPKELNLLFHKSDYWVQQHTFSNHLQHQTIMEIGLNPFFFLYTHFKNLGKEDTIILVDHSLDVMKGYKHYIEALNPNPNIIYLVSGDNKLPIQTASVDTAIDYYSSNYYNFYSQDSLLSNYQIYLKSSGHMLVTYSSLDNVQRSSSNLGTLYPNSHPGIFSIDSFKALLEEYYQIEEKERIGYACDANTCTILKFLPCNTKLYVDCFDLRRLSR